MDQLEVCALEQIESSFRIAALDQQARASLNQPFVIQGRNRCEPTLTLIKSLTP
jgi:hypothetical protein